MKHIAIYYRVSTDKQDIDSQVKAVNDWLDNLPKDRMPITIELYKELGWSGSNDKRPEMLRMLADAKAGKIDTIVVYRLDRFSRNASDAIYKIIELDKINVCFVSVTQPILDLSSSNPFRRTMLAAFAEIAEIERDTLITRVNAGIAAAKAKGVKFGAPCKLTADVVEQACELRSKGLSYRDIAKQIDMSTTAVFQALRQIK